MQNVLSEQILSVFLDALGQRLAPLTGGGIGAARADGTFVGDEKTFTVDDLCTDLGYYLRYKSDAFRYRLRKGAGAGCCRLYEKIVPLRLVFWGCRSSLFEFVSQRLSGFEINEGVFSITIDAMDGGGGVSPRLADEEGINKLTDVNYFYIDFSASFFEDTPCGEVVLDC